MATDKQRAWAQQRIADVLLDAAYRLPKGSGARLILLGLYDSHMDVAGELAAQHYCQRFDHNVYNQVTHGLTDAQCNEMIDNAMFLCGHPAYYPTDQVNDLPVARRFWALF